MRKLSYFNWKFFVVPLVCVLMLGPYFCYLHDLEFLCFEHNFSTCIFPSCLFAWLSRTLTVPQCLRYSVRVIVIFCFYDRRCSCYFCCCLSIFIVLFPYLRLCRVFLHTIWYIGILNKRYSFFFIHYITSNQHILPNHSME